MGIVSTWMKEGRNEEGAGFVAKKFFLFYYFIQSDMYKIQFNTYKLQKYK